MFRVCIIFSVKYLDIASMSFFEKKEKFKNSGYSFDQLNKLALFESYREKKMQQ